MCRLMASCVRQSVRQYRQVTREMSSVFLPINLDTLVDNSFSAAAAGFCDGVRAGAPVIQSV